MVSRRAPSDAKRLVVRRVGAFTKNSDGANVSHAASSSGRRENCVDAVLREGAIVVVGSWPCARRRRRRIFGGQQAVHVQVVERRQQLAVGQVAGAAEDDDGDRRDFTMVRLTAWPPN